MKKAIGIFLGLLALIPFVGIAFFIYYKVPTTPALIVTLIILMTGVMIAYYIYTKKTKGLGEETVEEFNYDFPSVETGVIQVNPSDFCEKLEKFSGNLNIYGFNEQIENITIVEGNYQKLTDELTLKFTQGIRVVLKGVQNIAVGNQQFFISDFSDSLLVQNRKRSVIQKDGRRLYIQSEGEEKNLKLKGKQAVLLFSWDE